MQCSAVQVQGACGAHLHRRGARGGVVVGGSLAVAQELRVVCGGLVHGARLQRAVRLRRRQRRVPPAHRLQHHTSECFRINHHPKYEFTCH